MGESKLKLAKREDMLRSCAGVQTVGGRVQVRWETGSAATPMGQLAYFIEFLSLSGLWSRWLEGCPLSYRSPNAPSKAEVLGTWRSAMRLEVVVDTGRCLRGECWVMADDEEQVWVVSPAVEMRTISGWALIKSLGA